MPTYTFSTFNAGTLALAAKNLDEVDYIKKEIIATVKKLDPFSYNTVGCFGWYWTRTSEGCKYFVYGFHLLPIWFTDFIKEFNSTFKNIQIEILDTRNLYIKTDVPASQRTVTTEIPKSNEPNAMSAAFCIHFSPDYPKNALRYAEYVVHHIVRQLSLLEFHWNSARYLFDQKPPYLRAVVFRSNNEEDKYRALAEKRITVNNLLNLDNIERAQKVDDLIINFRKYSGGWLSIRQTEIFGLFTRRMTFCLDRRLDPGKIVEFAYLRDFGKPRNFEILHNGIYNYANSDKIVRDSGFLYCRQINQSSVMCFNVINIKNGLEGADHYKKMLATYSTTA